MKSTPDIELETLAAFGQLVASVAHKLNNDLTAVRGYSDLLQEDLRELADGDAKFADIAEQAEALRTEIHGASNAIGSLVAFTSGRRKAGRQEPAAIVNEVISVVGASLSRAGVAVTCEVDHNVSGLDGANTGALQRMLLLLLLVSQKVVEGRKSDKRLSVSVGAAEAFTGVRVSVGHEGTIAEDDETGRKRVDVCAAIAAERGGTFAADVADASRSTYVIELPA
jgi:C4-dicarboxylate-specific signal transduction histidine kinase